MPIVFLSPSTQDWNPYVTGSGSEEYWMNRIVDAMEPYLRSNGIRYRRNDPDTSAGAAIREANMERSRQREPDSRSAEWQQPRVLRRKR